MTRDQLLAFRSRQEKIYTVWIVQQMADNKVHPSKEETMNLDRYARWHFGRSLIWMIGECQSMEAFNLVSAMRARPAPHDRAVVLQPNQELRTYPSEQESNRA